MCSGWLSAYYWGKHWCRPQTADCTDDDFVQRWHCRVREQTPLHGPSAGTGKLWGGGGFTLRIRITYNTIAPSGSSGLAAKSASRAQHSIFVTTKLSSGLWTVECCALTAGRSLEPGQTVVINYQAQHNLQFCRLGVQWNIQTENHLNHHYYFPCGTLKWHTVRNCVRSAPPAPALRFQTVVMTTNFCKFLWYIMFRLPNNVQLAVSSQRTIISNQRFRRLDLE